VTGNYLDRRTYPHMAADLWNCCDDPGELTLAQAAHARELHDQCSSNCRVRPRIEQSSSTSGGVAREARAT
jgi:hypothetical protein